MKITYEKATDVAYITFGNEIGNQEIVFTYPCDPVPLENTQINMDFAKDFVLRGIEILDASKHLPKEVLDNAEIV